MSRHRTRPEEGAPSSKLKLFLEAIHPKDARLATSGTAASPLHTCLQRTHMIYRASLVVNLMTINPFHPFLSNGLLTARGSDTHLHT
jgi:hypothetical protein